MPTSANARGISQTEPAAESRAARLTSVLDKAFTAATAVLITGSAGSGKTSAVLNYARHTERSPEIIDLDDVTCHRQTGKLASTKNKAGSLLVFDNSDSLLACPSAQASLRTFISDIPANTRVVVTAREEPTGILTKFLLDGLLTHVGEDELALTGPEAVELLAAQGVHADVALQARASVNGWLAGTLLVGRYGARSLVVEDYLRHVTLDALAPEERAFLLDVAVLQEPVTAHEALAMAGADGVRLFGRISRMRPAGTSVLDGALKLSPLVAGLLRDEALKTQPDRVRHARTIIATQHLRDGRSATAAREFLEVPDFDSAAEAIERLAGELRADENWPAMREWIACLPVSVVNERPQLLTQDLRSMFGARDYPAFRRRVDELHEQGLLESAVRCDRGLVATIGAALRNEPLAALQIMAAYKGDYRAEGVRYMLECLTSQTRRASPHGLALLDGHGLATWALLTEGRLSEIPDVVDGADDPEFAARSHCVLALLWQGSHRHAFDIWAQAPESIRGEPHYWLVEGMVELFFGRNDSAAVALERGIVCSQSTGLGREEIFEVFLAYALAEAGEIEEAKLLLRKLVAHSSETHQHAVAELAEAILGFCLLLTSDETAAAEVLENCTRSMTKSGRLLLFPFAGVCLAEVRHRAGRISAAREAGQRAYATAEHAGSFYWLLAALKYFPDVRARQLASADPAPGWSRLNLRHDSTVFDGRRRLSRSTDVTVELSTFGNEPSLSVRGIETPCHRMKVMELLAYLALHPEGVDRQDLQRALLPDADRRSGGNHFRQISHQLRELTGLRLTRSETIVRLPVDVHLVAADVIFERLVSAANLAVGASRRDLLAQAISTASGPYLLKSSLEWAEERRYALEAVLESAAAELATFYFEAGCYAEASRYAESVLASDPFNETMHRVALGAERVLGSEASFRALLDRKRRAMAEALSVQIR